MAIRVMEEESYLNGIPISWPSPMAPPPATTKPIPCSSCSTSTALLFCHHHSAFLCLNCDAKLHLNPPSTHHHRVPLCELCERAPAALTCKADSASLCVHCDAEIHSANPLSRRHDRVRVAPLDAGKSSLPAPIVFGGFDVGDLLVPTVGDVDRETSKQVVPLPLCPNEVKYFTDLDDPLLGFDLPDFREKMVSFSCFDGVVPIHNTSKANSNCSAITSFDNFFGKPELLIYATHTPVQTAPSPSEAMKPIGHDPMMTTAQVPALGTDREARVLRYKEKRKKRKFEKTIRYASRKAYAETRPRIKGRFAKRTDPDLFSDLLFESDAFPYAADHFNYGVVSPDHLGFGVVPSY